MFRYVIAILSLYLSLSLPVTAEQLHSISGETMGTVYHIKWLANPPSDLQADIDNALDALNDQVSTYRTQAQIARYNRSNVQQPIIVGDDFIKILNASVELYQQTAGSLDVTAAPLVNLWGFGPNQIAKLPSDAQIQHAKNKMGLGGFELQGNTLIKQTSGATLDFSAIAKGYGVDRVATLLDEHHIENYMVEIGGEVRLKGHNSKLQPWKIAVLQPNEQQQQIQQVIHAKNMAIATSGDYLNYYRHQGQVYSHLIDPQQGKPINNQLASVTVLHSSCMYADGYATALSVMGIKRAIEFANNINLPVMLIERQEQQFKVYYAGGFESYILDE